MEPPDIQIDTCGYSYHTNSFSMSPKHGAKTYIFRLQTEGSCLLSLNKEQSILKPGDLLLVKPGDFYELHLETKNGRSVESGDFFILCNGSWLNQWWNAMARPQKTKIIDYSKIRDLWHLLIWEHRRMDGGKLELKSSLLQSICFLLDRLISEATIPYSVPAFLASGMKHYIEANATKQLQLKEVAGHVGLSVSRAVYLFNFHFGISILQYAQKIRLSIAIELMKNSPMSLEQVAEAAGFGSYTNFHQVFRKHNQIAPGVFRKSNWNGAK